MSAARALAECREIDRAGDNFFDRGGQLADAARVDEQARFAMPHRFGHAFDARGDDRHAGRHRFEHDHRQPFAEQARQHEQVDLGQLAIDAAREADPVDRVGEAEPLGQAANGRFVGRRFEAADHPQPHVPVRDRSMASVSSSTSVPLRGRKRATVPSVQLPPGVRRCGCSPAAGTPLGTQTTRSAAKPRSIMYCRRLGETVISRSASRRQAHSTSELVQLAQRRVESRPAGL